MGIFNFTKIHAIDMFHDSAYGTTDPKLKGFFICLLVKPDLNLPNPKTDFITDVGHNIPNGAATRSYDPKTWQRKIFRGTLNPYVYENLTHTTGFNYFSQIFSNHIESISYPDIGSNSEDTLVSLDKQIYKLPVTESGSSGLTFNVRLRENEGHDVLRFLTVWHKYIQAVTGGHLVPKTEYLRFDIIDYKASLYTLHVKPDFKTITMFSKYTGIYPSNIPVSIMSESIEDVSDVALDVEFTYDKFEWFNEDILREINLLTSNQPITKESLLKNSAWTLSKNRRKFISKIKDSPYYKVDLNGLDTALSRSGVSVEETPAGLFGAKWGGLSNSFFPAAMNEGMINASTSNSLINAYGKIGSKNVPDKSNY